MSRLLFLHPPQRNFQCWFTAPCFLSASLLVMGCFLESRHEMKNDCVIHFLFISATFREGLKTLRHTTSSSLVERTNAWVLWTQVEILAGLLLPGQPWASCLISLRLSFLFHKMRNIKTVSEGCCESSVYGVRKMPAM